jgi:hypothetical protein
VCLIFAGASIALAQISWSVVEKPLSSLKNYVPSSWSEPILRRVQRFSPLKSTSSSPTFEVVREESSGPNGAEQL